MEAPGHHPTHVEVALAWIDQAVLAYGATSVYGLFSGGHDSLTATAIAAKHPNFRGVVHINTGIGIEQTRDFVRHVCAEEGWELHELHAERGTYEDLVLNRGGFPYGIQSHNVMYHYLKQQPFRRWFKTVTGRVALVTGIRRDESVRRMGAGISTPIRYRRDKEPRHVWVSPILDWTKIDCGRFIESEGLPRNRVVDLLHRSGECLCGALARPGEIHEIARWFPSVAARIHDLERECEHRQIVASVWASRTARALSADQMQLFSKADLAPLCSSCLNEAEQHEDVLHRD